MQYFQTLNCIINERPFNQEESMTENELTRIIGLYSGCVFKTAFCYMKSRADADDIQQEAFLKLFLCDKRFESDEHIKAWLLRITANLCKNRLKSAWYRFSLPLEAAADMADENELKDDFLALLFRLKPKYRITLYMYYYEGYSIKEIAAATGEKDNTVISRLSRGRKKLKDILIEENYNEIQ